MAVSSSRQFGLVSESEGQSIRSTSHRHHNYHSNSDLPNSDGPSNQNDALATAIGSQNNVRFLESSRSSIDSSRSGARDKHDIAVKFLEKKCRQARWLEDPEDEFGIGGEIVSSKLGVMLRRPDGFYTAEPMFLNADIVSAVERLGVAVAVTMSTEIVWSLEEHMAPLQNKLTLDRAGSVMPIARSVRDIGTSRCEATKESYLCYCREERFILIWSLNVKNILSHGNDIETLLLGLVWGGHIATPEISTSPYRNSRSMISRPSLAPERHSMQSNIGNSNLDAAMSEKMEIVTAALEKEELGNKHYDPEKQKDEDFERPFLILHAMMIGLAIVLVVVVELSCVAKIITEIRLDGQMLRLALLATIPLFATFSLFFMIVITGSLFQLFGPLPTKNSRYYSCIAPKLGRFPDYELPHITIQLPVYKEGLKNVIIPTVNSCVKAIKYYESQGGSANIFVNEDGIQLVSAEQAEARKAFYELHHIGWCARPGHNTTTKDDKGKTRPLSKDDASYFERRGQFKKASNMNYCLDFSLRVEEEFERLLVESCQARRCHLEDLTVEEEVALYDTARTNTIEQDNGRTWAAGDCRVGELVLIIDSDTRVPEDCLVYAALEMHESPEVAILQHASGIMQVVNNIFENGITYFTNLIYTSIQFAVGSGDCGPFVGHNSILRWKAIQSIAEHDAETGRMLFWSESHVSEDFDVSLRLQMAGFIVRLATYHRGGFQEGVSLTIYDELARWEKYAYGCNELVFNPLMYWPIRGPFTKLFLKFCFSNIKITSKITIFAYIFTYYAIASAIPLTLANYFVVGWFSDSVDQFYLSSWKIFVGMAVVFNVLSPLAYAMLRHRLGQKTFFWSLVETAKWTPMFLIFFGGLSFSLSKAILCHFFTIRMEWTTTAKELEEHGFRAGLDRIIRDFKGMYLFVVACTGAMIYLALFAPRGWRIEDFAAIVPLANQVGCHALLPFVLGLF